MLQYPQQFWDNDCFSHFEKFKNPRKTKDNANQKSGSWCMVEPRAQSRAFTPETGLRQRQCSASASCRRRARRLLRGFSVPLPVALRLLFPSPEPFLHIPVSRNHCPLFRERLRLAVSWLAPRSCSSRSILGPVEGLAPGLPSYHCRFQVTAPLPSR